MATLDTTASGQPRGPIRENLAELGDLTRFGGSALASSPGAMRYAAEVLRQTSILVVGSSFFIAALTFFIGFSAVNFTYFTLKALGAVDFIGVFTGFVSPRVAAAFTFGFGYAAKVGCGIVSEIGAMRVNEELDAYEAEGVSPMRYVIGTRILATLIYAPLAAGLALLAFAAGAYVDGIVVLQGLEGTSFWRYHWAMQGIPDLTFALVTMVLIAVTQTLVACYYGYRTSGGPAGVGAATARSLVVNIPLGIILISLADFLVYGVGHTNLPLGG